MKCLESLVREKIEVSNNKGNSRKQQRNNNKKKATTNQYNSKFGVHVVLGLRKQSDNHQFGLLSSGLTAVTASTLRLQCVCVCMCVRLCQMAMHFSFIRRNNMFIVVFIAFLLYFVI